MKPVYPQMCRKLEHDLSIVTLTYHITAVTVHKLINTRSTTDVNTNVNVRMKKLRLSYSNVLFWNRNHAKYKVLDRCFMILFFLFQLVSAIMSHRLLLSNWIFCCLSHFDVVFINPPRIIFFPSAGRGGGWVGGRIIIKDNTGQY